MIKQRTTIVVGAGASAEIGLPVGGELLDRIKDLLLPSEKGYEIFADAQLEKLVDEIIRGDKHAQQERQIWVRAIKQMRAGLKDAASIDNYLHTHQNDDRINRLGKIAIAILILKAERSSTFFEKEAAIDRLHERDVSQECSIDRPHFEKSWLAPFARLLMAGTRAENPAEAFENVSFVIFNYDRCVEEYLYQVIQRYFGIDCSDAAELLGKVEFIHPYGSLGPLPWQVNDATEATPLGAHSDVECLEAASRIKTFTETIAEETDVAVRRAIAHAETIILLGFGYNPQNMELLTPKGGKTATRFFSTAKGINLKSYDPLRRIIESLSNYSPINQIYIEDEGCRELFDTFQLPLNY